MKKAIVLRGLTVLALMVALASCQVITTSAIKARLDSFAGSLSNGTDRNSCYTNFYVGTTGYNAGAGGSVFNTANFPVGSYYFSNIDESTTTAVTAKLYGPGGYALGYPVNLNMRADSSGNYFIYSITITTGGTPISF